MAKRNPVVKSELSPAVAFAIGVHHDTSPIRVRDAGALVAYAHPAVSNQVRESMVAEVDAQLTVKESNV